MKVNQNELDLINEEITNKIIDLSSQLHNAELDEDFEKCTEIRDNITLEINNAALVLDTITTIPYTKWLDVMIDNITTVQDKLKQKFKNDKINLHI
jgi:hypothetical protein